MSISRIWIGIAALASTSLLYADFTYQQTTQITGGMMASLTRVMGGASREPIVTTHILKGNRLATLTKDHTSIIDIDKETITEIDHAKKTYSVMTFAQMKAMMDEALSQVKGANADLKYKISAKATGQAKTVNGIDTKQVLMTMAMDVTDQKSKQGGSMDIVMDNWIGEVPGYEEAKGFYKRMGEKMGYLYGSGMSQLAAMQPDTRRALEEAAKEMAKVEGVPIQTNMKMGFAGSAEQMAAAAEAQRAAGEANASADAAGKQAQPEPKPEVNAGSAAASAAGAALGRLGMGGLGGFGRNRKQAEPPPQQTPPPAARQQQQAAPASSGSLMETVTTLTSFSSASADSSKFDVPAGFKQVDPPTAKGIRR